MYRESTYIVAKSTFMLFFRKHPQVLLLIVCILFWICIYLSYKVWSEGSTTLLNKVITTLVGLGASVLGWNFKSLTKKIPKRSNKAFNDKAE